MESGNGSGHGGAVDRTQKIQAVRGVAPRSSWRALQGTGRQRIRATPEGGEAPPLLGNNNVSRLIVSYSDRET